MSNKAKRDEMRVLTEEQSQALREVLNQKYTIHPDGNRAFYPELTTQPYDLINVVMARLLAKCVPITSVRLNGGAASHVLMTSKIQDRAFNDLDITFMLAEEKSLTEFARIWDTIRTTLLNLLREYVMGAIHEHSPTRLYLQNCPEHILEQIYVQKLIMIPKWHHHERETPDLGPDEDCWSLICFRNFEGRNVEFKFVNRLKRCYEFPTDSFQIILNEEVLGGRDTPGAHVRSGEGSEVEGKEKAPATYTHKTQYLSCHPDLDEALEDLRENRLGIYKPEELRGGGFLRYIQLCLKGAELRIKDKDKVDRNERLMLNRFLLDFRTQASMAHVLANFIQCHYPQNDNLKNIEAAIKFLYKIEDEVESSRIHKCNRQNGCLHTAEFIDAVREHRYVCQHRRHDYLIKSRHAMANQKEDEFNQSRHKKGKSKKGKNRKRHFGRHRNGNQPTGYVLEPRNDNWGFPPNHPALQHARHRYPYPQARGMRPAPYHVIHSG